MERSKKSLFLHTAGMMLAVLLLLLLCGTAAADGPHTIVVNCRGGGFVGISDQEDFRVTLTPDTRVQAADGSEWTLETLFHEPGFRLEGATLRFTVSEVQGANLLYSLFCGYYFSTPQRVLEGCNMWDISIPFSIWMESPQEPLCLAPMHELSEFGFQVREDSATLQLTFSVSSRLPLFPLDRVQDRPFY